MMKWNVVIALLLVAAGNAMATETVVNERQASYREAGAGNFDAARGESMWSRQQMHAEMGQSVSCATCHSGNLSTVGKHIRTGKLIDPMAPSMNAERLTDAAKIEKWFTRNCKWTWGRECTAQEKGDFLQFIQSR